MERGWAGNTVRKPAVAAPVCVSLTTGTAAGALPNPRAPPERFRPPGADARPRRRPEPKDTLYASPASSCSASPAGRVGWAGVVGHVGRVARGWPGSPSAVARPSGPLPALR